MLENRPPLELKNNATFFSDISQSELNWASYVVFVKTDDARTMPRCRTPFSFSLVYLLCVKSSPKPLFVYFRGEHCLNAGRTLSTCGENGFPFVQQPPVSRFTHVSSRVYFATFSIRPPWDLVVLTNQSTAYMPQEGSNLRLSQLHPLRPSHTDQSQGLKVPITYYNCSLFRWSAVWTALYSYLTPAFNIQKLFSYMILPSEAQPVLHEVRVKTTEMA